MQNIKPQVAVGIMFQPVIEFSLTGKFIFNGKAYQGDYAVRYEDGKILFGGEPYDEVIFEPADSSSTFLLKNVIIGIGFHWERAEDQRFEGSLKIIVEDGKLTAINRLSVEDYLISVISSEMSATSSLELLKAHTVISRSWMLSQIEKREALEADNSGFTPDVRTATEWTKWWDREDHTRFDVCADDHCQRYQGITRASQSIDMVRRAVAETSGELLMNGNRIADARFSKCCGGVFEKFENCWEPVSHPYLVARADRADATHFPDLRLEAEAAKCITTSPEAYCNTTDPEILSQVLNNYDQETADFYRWTVDFKNSELSDLIYRKIGVDFGEIISMEPLERGTSGRIIRMRIIGSKCTLIIGKELLIRKALSESHLYSSAFTVEKTAEGFRLVGAGWGHGVGLCQIGAAVMAHRGIAYRTILEHYFPNATIEKRY